MIVLDTHALVWADRDDRKLGRKARATLNKLWPAGEVAAPAIVFWELGLLEANGRVRLPLPVRDWRLALIAAGLLELPLTGEIAREIAFPCLVLEHLVTVFFNFWGRSMP